MAKSPKDTQLPDALVRILAEAEAQRLAHDDTAFEIAARKRGLSLSGRPIAPAAKAGEIDATPYEWIDPGLIPPRQWLYGRTLIRKFLSVTVAPGGVGKSSLSLAEALAMVTGRPILGQNVPRPLRVWMWNLEDPKEDLQRRIQAICERYDISREDIAGRLFIDSGRDRPLTLASIVKNRPILNRAAADQVTATLLRREIDVLIIDPFVSSHTVPENDNTAMDLVSKEWSRIAERADCAIHLVHHTRKLGSDADVTAESSRGGKALTDAARVVRTINRMSHEDGEKYGVDNHRNFIRAYNDKANMAPPSDISEWYQLIDIHLPNGDQVGTVVSWSPPDAFSDVDASDLLKVQTKIDSGDWREDARSTLWAGIAVAEVLGLDTDHPAHKQKIKTLIKTWVSNGALRIETIVDEWRKQKRAVRVGRWVE